jgi:riboflavin biosynthesis pyrimidine reductase
MRALLPRSPDRRHTGGDLGTDSEIDGGTDTAIDVHEWYAADWLDGGGLRVNFVASADGAATVAGVSRGLQTPGDNAVFAALRDLADVVLIGAGTARAEGYRPIRLDPARVEVRARFGLSPHLPTAVASRALRLDPDAPLFADSPSQAQTIVITGSAGDEDVLARLRRRTDVIEAKAEEPAARDAGAHPGGANLAAALRALAERGLTRVLCEGGPHLFAQFAAAGLVDEVCLSLTPLLVGPGPERIIAGMPFSDPPRALSLAGLLEEDGALFCRYRRGAAG